MTKKWLQLFAMSVLLHGSGCVYESFQDPTFIGTANVSTTDGGGMDAEVEPDMSTPDMGGDDAGSDADMEMPPEPWQCPPVTVDSESLEGSRVQVEALGSSGWLVGYLDLNGALQLKTLDTDGNEVSSDFIAGNFVPNSNGFALLTSPVAGGIAEESYYVGGVTNSGMASLYQCDDGCQEVAGDFQMDADRIAGFWRGGQEAPYVAVRSTTDTSRILVRANTDIGVIPVVMSTEAPNTQYLSLSAIQEPSNPTLTTPTNLGFVSDRTISMSERLNSGEPLIQASHGCGSLASNVRKVHTLFADKDTIFADVVDGEQRTTLARIDCEESNPTLVNITGPLEGLRAWDVFVATGYTRTFYALENVLATRRFDSDILDENVVANGRYQRVSAAVAGARIGLATIDTNGTVEFRTMRADGSCN